MSSSRLDQRKTYALSHGRASAPQGDTMSTNQADEEEAPSNITTDAESQEYGALQGQTPEGEETGSSAPDAEAEPDNNDAGEPGEGTGAKGGEYS
jgi:hypothetical protein